MTYRVRNIAVAVSLALVAALVLLVTLLPSNSKDSGQVNASKEGPAQTVPTQAGPNMASLPWRRARRVQRLSSFMRSALAAAVDTGGVQL